MGEPTPTRGQVPTPTPAPGTARRRPLADFAAAVAFLTLLPVAGGGTLGHEARPVGWYPWVGWVLGLLVAVPLWVVLRVAGPLNASGSLLAGALVVVTWAVLTRFLHWDGLADTTDGLWGGSTPARRLEIMRDSHIGSFGTTAIVMAALLQVASVSAVVSRGALWVLVVVPVAGRAAVSAAAWQLPAARRDGLGLTAMERPGRYDVSVALCAVLALALTIVGTVGPAGTPVAWFLLTGRMVVVLAAGVAAALIVPRMLAEPVGGMTGDLFGATVLLVETAVLVVAALVG